MAGTNPRAARIAALIQRVIASSMEAQLHDKRLANVTITEVRVTNDLQIAKVYWTQLGHEGHEQGERRRAQHPGFNVLFVQTGADACRRAAARAGHPVLRRAAHG